MDKNMPKYGRIKDSLPTQYDEKIFDGSMPSLTQDDKVFPSRGSLIEKPEQPEFDELKSISLHNEEPPLQHKPEDSHPENQEVIKFDDVKSVSVKH